MKRIVLILCLLTQSAFACDTRELRKEIFGMFEKDMPVSSQLGEKRAVSTLKEITLTDSLLHVRGEDFFITRLVFEILWASGLRQEKEILLAALVDLNGCRLESFDAGDVLGSSTSRE